MTGQMMLKEFEKGITHETKIKSAQLFFAMKELGVLKPSDVKWFPTKLDFKRDKTTRIVSHNHDTFILINELVNNKKIEIMDMKGSAMFSLGDTKIEGLATQKKELVLFFVGKESDNKLLDLYQWNLKNMKASIHSSLDLSQG